MEQKFRLFRYVAEIGGRTVGLLGNQFDWRIAVMKSGILADARYAGFGWNAASQRGAQVFAIHCPVKNVRPTFLTTTTIEKPPSPEIPRTVALRFRKCSRLKPMPTQAQVKRLKT